MGRNKGINQFKSGGMKTPAAAKVKKDRVARDATMQCELETVPAPMGLPAGWVAEKHVGPTGKVQVRYASSDGKHKKVNTVSRAIRADAADKGYDAEPVVEAYQKKRDEEEKQIETAKKNALAAFKAKHGDLDHSTVASMPGWRLEPRTIAATGSKQWTFIAPNGNTYLCLKDVEVALGNQMLGGTLIQGIEQARTAKVAVQGVKKCRRKHVPKSQRKRGGDMEVDTKKKVKKTIGKKTK